MRTKYTVKLKRIVEDCGMTALHKSKNFDTAVLTTADVNRPAMQLTGFYNYFDPSRIQIIGRVESTYLSTLTPEERRHTFERFMQYDIAALVICHGCEPFPECIEMAEKYDRNLFTHEDNTSDFQANIIGLLRSYLAPRISTHGVLVEVYGEGVLLMGDSGIGKSETALELVKRGHRLIADDAVDIKRVDKRTLVGSAPEIIRYFMELRGIGIINVRHIYGIGAVKPFTNIDLVIKMEPWIEGKAYQRLGTDEEQETILDVTLPAVTVPVKPGRNLAVIVELAAMNNRQKKMGYNDASDFVNYHDSAVDANLL